MKVKTKKDGTVRIGASRETVDKILSLLGKTTGEHPDLCEMYDRLRQYATTDAYEVTVGWPPNEQRVRTLHLTKKETAH
ncbi:hypothetical protein [Robbsia andropogonis]|uniref:hypothetical protein n=1 Tax=Robbsia andropogonis TaxID=28092 RepID=UPI002A6A8A86|nr:hypothetical protein [Robbsia andropogonis]